MGIHDNHIRYKMMIDKRGMIVFVSMALATTCDAFSVGVTPYMKTQTQTQRQRHTMPLRAFASDTGDMNLQNEHFAVSSSTSSLSQDTTQLAPPPMARPAENNRLAMVDNNNAEAQTQAPPPTAVEEEEPYVPQQSVWERNKPADVQGGSLRTWSFADQHKIDMIQVHMKTDGRPMNANRT